MILRARSASTTLPWLRRNRAAVPSYWGYTRGMPKVSVYLPDELYRAAQARKLPLSALAQDAVERALRRSDRQDWVARVRSRPRRCTAAVDSAAVLDEVRSEFGR